MNTNKKLYTLILCALLLVQPLKPITSNKTHNETIVCIIFLTSCAIFGMITSYFKKSAAKKSNIDQEKLPSEISKELNNRIAYLDNAAERLNLRITRQETNLPTILHDVNNMLNKQNKKITILKQNNKILEQKCNKLTEQNTQLLTTIESSTKKGVNGYVPAFVAAYWFHTCIEQTKAIDKQSSQNILSRSS